MVLNFNHLPFIWTPLSKPVASTGYLVIPWLHRDIGTHINMPVALSLVV